MKMCVSIDRNTTKETMSRDITYIRYNLHEISKENPRIYKSIKPLVDSILSHLLKVHEWIDETEIKNEQSTYKNEHKTDKQIEIDAHETWFYGNSLKTNGVFRHDYDFIKSQKAWLAAKGFNV